MKEVNIRSVVTVGGIAFVGYWVLIGTVLFSCALFPTRTLFPDTSSVIDESSVLAALALTTLLHEVVPGFVVGAVLGAVAAFLLPGKRLSIIMLPSAIIFVMALIWEQVFGMPDNFIQKDWRWFFTSFLPMWVVFFIGTVCAAVVVRKLGFPNQRLQVIDNDACDTSAPVRSE